MRMRRLSLVLAGSVALAFFVPRVASTQQLPSRPSIPARPAVPQTAQARPFVGRALPSLPLNAAALTTFTDVNGQMVGAGSNFVTLLQENGTVKQQFKTTVARPTISPHGANAILIGNMNDKTIARMDLQTGAVTPLLKVADVQDPSATAAPEGTLLKDGAFASVASDGTNVFVAVEAGFSSAIFKINPTTKQIVSRAWASAPDPSAMVASGGALFVLADGGKELRRFTDTLERSRDGIALPAASKGLGVRAGEIRSLAATSSQVQRVSVAPTELQRSSVIANLDRPKVAKVQVRNRRTLEAALPRRYAVLITGDLAENFSGECFWNDTVWMYKALVNNGYREDDIFVLYGDGADYISANPTYRHPRTVTDFAATVVEVNAVFAGLKNGDVARGIPKIRSNDTLFLWTFDHGGRRSSGEATLCLRDGVIGAEAFATKLNALTYHRRSVFMQQCYSGGFVEPLKNAQTFVSTAASATELAYPADTEFEIVGGRTYSHGEYNFHAISALDRHTPLNALVSADTAVGVGNSDSRVSALEMHRWVVKKESRSETPQMNDMGGVGSAMLFVK